MSSARSALHLPLAIASLIALMAPAPAASGAAPAPAGRATLGPAPAPPESGEREYRAWRLLPRDNIENVKEALRLGLGANHPLVLALERNGAFMSAPEPEIGQEPPPLATPFATLTAPQLAADAIVNMHGLTCTNCKGQPTGQVEPSVGVHGNNVVVAFNDYGATCRGGTRENFGYSTDGGATFTDALAFLSTTSGTLFGDPSVAVNHKTAEFYIGGLHSTTGGPGGFDIGAVRGVFSGTSFVQNLGKRAVTNLDHANYFFDRPFMAVDSLTGNVYFTWAAFGPLSDAIEFQACDSQLNPITPIEVLAPEDTTIGYQDAQPTVGPDGVLYVTWWATRWTAGDFIMVRRSMDHGATFEPAVVASAFEGNFGNPPPGGQRLFSYVVPSIVVDNTTGPRRGRIYLAWEGAINFRNAPFTDATVRFETESNNTYLTANSFVPGGKIRGFMNGAEKDFFSFSGIQGQTLVLDNWLTSLWDSCGATFNARIHFVPNPADPSTDRVVCESALYASFIVYTLPTTGTYYLEVYGLASTGAYVFQTALMSPGPSDIARDVRDPLFAWSDDGLNWSTPLELADDPPGFDSVYPSLAVDGEGRVHCFWLDYRDDPVYATTCQAFTTSSGDGGLTWGANRPIADAGAVWPSTQCLSNFNSIGDYMQMAADGDRVVSAFTDARLGDSDIWADGSLHAELQACPGAVTITTSPDTLVEFDLANTGNYTREFQWSLSDSRGWITAVSPGRSGTQSLGPGQQLTVLATVVPVSCVPDSTVLAFAATDTKIPGATQTCVTSVRCVSAPTPALVALVTFEAQPDHVTLMWQGPDHGVEASVYRRGVSDAWTLVGRGAFDGAGHLEYEDRFVVAGARYAYRVGWPGAGGEQLSAETWVEVPGMALLALETPRPNPTRGRLELAFTLPREGPATLALVDVSGRPRLAREVGSLGAGRHLVELGEPGQIPPGVYWLKLTQSGKSITRSAVVLR